MSLTNDVQRRRQYSPMTFKSIMINGGGMTDYISERLWQLAVLVFYLNKVLSYIDNILVNYWIFCISGDTVYPLKGKNCQRLIVAL